MKKGMSKYKHLLGPRCNAKLLFPPNELRQQIKAIRHIISPLSVSIMTKISLPLRTALLGSRSLPVYHKVSNYFVSKPHVLSNNYLSSAPPCSDGDVRLLLERVQICHNQTWGYVCYDSDWNVEDASVVCRELGLLPPQGRQCI